MKLDEKQRQEVLEVYNTWLYAYLNGDIVTYDFYFDDEYRFIGSTINEEFLDRKDTTAFFEQTSDQLARKTDLRNDIITVEASGGIVFITHLFDAYFLNEGNWNYYGRFRFTSTMQQKPGGWKFIYQHFSMPDAKSEEGDTIGYNRVAEENEELKEAIKRRTIELETKNRELELEASLERVRAVAMGLRNRDDILDICKGIFTELQLLGFFDLRNSLINFWDDESQALIDYDYSDYAGGHKAKLSYSSHPVFEQFQKKIRESKDAFAELVVKEDLLESWKQRRRDSGEYEDPRLENINALYYYFYSIGVGAIGISTFSSLTTERINILKRFRNVFNLAYQRYQDIDKAEEQARDAQIELALERVRARTMAMHGSEELAETASVLFRQIKELGFETWSCGFCIWAKNELAEVWMGADSGGLLPPMMIPYREEPTHRKIYESSLAQELAHDYIWEGEELAEHYTFLETIPTVKGAIEQLKSAGLTLPSRQCYYVGFFKQGYLLLITTTPNAKLKDLSRRFATAFDGTYTRFLDLQTAEAQAREAKIEAALERTRTHTMLMQHSNELDITSRVFHEQLLLLGIDSELSYVWLPDVENDKHLFWATWNEERDGSYILQSKSATYDLDRTEPYTAECFNAWESGEHVHVYRVAPAEVKHYFDTWSGIMGDAEKTEP